MTFIFFLTLTAQAASFSPEVFSRDLQRHFLRQLSHSSNPRNYRELDLLFKTQKMLRISCEIELRDMRAPESCTHLLDLWEQTLHRKDLKSRKLLERKRQMIAKKTSIQEYINSRKSSSLKHSLGTESE